MECALLAGDCGFVCVLFSVVVLVWLWGFVLVWWFWFDVLMIVLFDYVVCLTFFLCGLILFVGVVIV